MAENIQHPERRWSVFGVQPHLPKVYRYRCAEQGVTAMLNRYGWKVIGVAVSFRGYAYCVKWAWAR